MTGSGTLEVRAPRIDDRRVDPAGQRHRFTSQILPSYMRKAPKVTEVLPILYLRGLSTGDFQAALPVLLGEEAGGLSPTTITRLTASWETEYHAWRRRDRHEVDYVYVWVDGVHFRVRLEEDRLCTLVMIGVRADPRAVASLRRDQVQLLTFYDVPAEHWRHLRTTNIIESPFATVRLRQRVTQGAGSRTKALMMAFKLLAMAEERWRKVNGPELLPLVRAGVRFVDGVQEKPKTAAGEVKENAA